VALMSDTTALIDRLRGAGPSLSVGLLTANLTALADDVRLLEEAGVALAHFDVMDGCFCPPLTLGPPFIKAVRTSLLKDVHLMIDEPLDKLEAYAAAGADLLTIHVESCRHPHRALQAISGLRNANDPGRPVLRGIALCPGTPVEAVEPLLDEVDLALLLAVNPGWGGQKFIASTPARFRKLRTLIGERQILSGLDGGVTRDNLVEVSGLGPDLIVTGSAVFDGRNPAQNLRQMLAVLRPAPAA
jgi:ribulose-phosphate 3-epimerase